MIEDTKLSIEQYNALILMFDLPVPTLETSTTTPELALFKLIESLVHKVLTLENDLATLSDLVGNINN